MYIEICNAGQRQNNVPHLNTGFTPFIRNLGLQDYKASSNHPS